MGLYDAVRNLDYLAGLYDAMRIFLNSLPGKRCNTQLLLVLSGYTMQYITLISLAGLYDAKRIFD